MNVLAAPFLYIMPSEVEAYFSFCKFIEDHCPTYVTPSLTGIHRGLHVRHGVTRSHTMSIDAPDPCLRSSWTDASRCSIQSSLTT
jgi:hypothetical protein